MFAEFVNEVKRDLMEEGGAYAFLKEKNENLYLVVREEVGDGEFMENVYRVEFNQEIKPEKRFTHI